jgi:hypothetical protein
MLILPWIFADLMETALLRLQIGSWRPLIMTRRGKIRAGAANSHPPDALFQVRGKTDCGRDEKSSTMRIEI